MKAAILGLLIAPFFIALVLPFVIMYLVVGLPFHLIHGVVLKHCFRVMHVRQGRFILFVHSNSPNWQEYLETNVFPRIRDHAVFLNWSERSQWKRRGPLEVRMLTRWGGSRNFNPMAIIVPPRGRVRVVRFHQAFRDGRHGKPEALHTAERELDRHIVEVLASVNPFARAL